jgi:hypothetical protein
MIERVIRPRRAVGDVLNNMRNAVLNCLSGGIFARGQGARHVSRTAGLAASFEPLEPRKLMSARVEDVRVGEVIDFDFDGNFRSVGLDIVLSATTRRDIYIRVLEDDGGFGDDFVFRSGTFTIDNRGAIYGVSLLGEFFDLPGDDGTRPNDFKVQVFDAATNDRLWTESSVNDSDLGNWRFESVEADGGRIGFAPVVQSVNVNPPTTVLRNDPIAVTARITDASANRGISAAFAWVDRNRNGRYDLVQEGETLGEMELVTGTRNDGTWRFTKAWGTDLGVGTYRGGVVAWDLDGNITSTFVFEFTVGDDQPPVVTGLTIAPRVVNLGSVFTLTATATDDIGLRAVSFFYDVNDNGIWNPGVDVDLGADFDASNGWSVTTTARPEWGSVAAARFVADALDTNGQWAASPLSLTARLNAAPTVTGTTIDGPGFLSPGDVLTVRATAQDDTGLRAVTFFIDRDQNSIWTPGVDIDLGADFDGGDGWSRSWIVQQSWGAGVNQIRAAAVDSDGVFSSPGSAASVTFNALPLVNQLSLVPANGGNGVVSIGERLTFIALPIDPDGQIRAVTFFFDLDSDGRWTPGVDVDVGADFDGGDGWSVSVIVPTFWGPGRANFVADAVDDRGAWASRRAGAAIRLNFPPEVLSVTSSPVGFVSWGDRLRLTAEVADDANTTRVVTFFFDLDSNGLWSPGDVDLGADFDGSNGWSIEREVPSWWGAGPARFVASGRDAEGVWSISTAGTQLRLNDRSQISGYVGTPNPVTLGSSLRLDIRARDRFGVDAVTFFVDFDGDGRWTSGVDLDLGAAGRLSGDANDGLYRSTVTANWGRGTFRVMADARDSDGVWSGATLLEVLVV